MTYAEEEQDLETKKRKSHQLMKAKLSVELEKKAKKAKEEGIHFKELSNLVAEEVKNIKLRLRNYNLRDFIKDPYTNPAAARYEEVRQVIEPDNEYSKMIAISSVHMGDELGLSEDLQRDLAAMSFLYDLELEKRIIRRTGSSRTSRAYKKNLLDAVKKDIKDSIDKMEQRFPQRTEETWCVNQYGRVSAALGASYLGFCGSEIHAKIGDDLKNLYRAFGFTKDHFRMTEHRHGTREIFKKLGRRYDKELMAAALKNFWGYDFLKALRK